MNGVPIHPALAHVPLGFALVLPLVILWLTFAIGRQKIPRQAWLFVVFLQIVTLSTGIASAKFGEQDRKETVTVVGGVNLDRHEEQAASFNLSSGISLAFGIAGLFAPVGIWATAGRIATLLTSGMSAGLGIAAGHSGGELVYRYGAAAAFVPPQAVK